MLTNEVITDNIERINTLIKYATRKGDDAPVIGTLIVLSMTDEEFENFQNPAYTMDVTETVASRLVALGVEA